eukprot:609160-Lingulodinium_polyedra.AAC.1
MQQSYIKHITSEAFHVPRRCLALGVLARWAPGRSGVRRVGASALRVFGASAFSVRFDIALIALW